MGSPKLSSSILGTAILISFLVMTACATSPQNDARGFLPNSAFGEFAPQIAPNTLESDKQIIDDTHLRTQADYHFSLGESFSLDGDSKRAVEEFKLTTVYDAKSASVRLRLASEFMKMGLLSEAQEQAEVAEKLDSKDIAVQMFLGELYSALKMYNQALDHYQQVYAQDPNNHDAPIYIGALYAEEEKYDEAEKYFLKAVTPDNEKAHLAYYYIGKMRMEQTEPNLKAAEKAFSKSLQMKADFEEGALALYDLYAQQNHRERGIKLLESFEDQFGPKKSVAYQLSQAYLETEDFDHAFKHLRTLESFEPSNLNVKVKIALILIEKKHYIEAIDKLEEIMAIAPGSDKIRFYLAAVYEETQHNELAINNYLKIEMTSTYYPDAVIHAAYLYRKANDLKTASGLMDKSIAARNDVPQFYAFYASLLDETKEYKKGVDLLQGAVKKFPENTQLHFYLGSLYDRVGKTDEAVAEMHRILALDGDYVQALNYLAFTYAELGKNLDEAETLGRKAMNLQPKDAYILDTVGWVLYKKGRTEEAIQYLEAAYKLKMEESVIAEHLGDAYYTFELAEKAKDMYMKAAATENDPAKVSKLRAKIANIDSTHERKPASTADK